MSFEEMWASLNDVGRSASSGGYFRRPFAAAERECAAWLSEKVLARGLKLRSDGLGNTIAWWGSGPDGVLTGSHLDSVPGGGAYDGPLGVVSAFAAVDLLSCAATALADTLAEPAA